MNFLHTALQLRHMQITDAGGLTCHRAHICDMFNYFKRFLRTK